MSQDLADSNFDRIIAQLKKQNWNLSPIVSGFKPDMQSKWSKATLTSDVDSTPTTGVGLRVGLEKSDYEMSSSLRYTSWTNASYTSFLIAYEKNYHIKRLFSFPIVKYLADVQLNPGVGVGLGHFTNALTNNSRLGLIFDVHVGLSKPISKKWSIFSNLGFQYVNLETRETNALDNTHSVTLNNATYVELGAKYYFGAMKKPVNKAIIEEVIEQNPEQIQQAENLGKAEVEGVLPSPVAILPVSIAPVKIPVPLVVNHQINGYVTELETGKALHNVKVKVFLNEKDIIAYTNERGFYSLPVELSKLPDSFVMAFSLKGYVPSSENITKKTDSGFVMNSELELESKRTVVLELEPNLHHLGDGNFKGAENSQFQVAAEGKAFTISFDITAEHLMAKTGVITLKVKGLNHENQLLLNNKFVAMMDTSPADGSFGDLVYKLSMSDLFEGKNNLSILSNTKGGGFDHDDFEFTNVIIRLTYE